MARTARIALAHDWLVGMRGGERVLERIAAIVAREHEVAGVWTMFDAGRPMAPAIDVQRRHASALGRLPGGMSNRLRRWLLPLYPLAVADLSRGLALDHRHNPIDLLISTSSAAVKGMRAPRGVRHVCYCHCPARYLWGQARQYSGGAAGLGLGVFGPALRAWDRRTSANVDVFVANSSHTREQVAECYGRDAEVVHPPVRVGFFARSGPDEAPEASDARSDYLLYVGALEPYKRVDLAIAAAIERGERMLVVGTGTEERRLRGAFGASAGIEFVGRVDDDRLRAVYRGARCLVFPQVEDFGIVAVEALAAGCPVAARASGGAVDIVEEGVSGALFEGDDVAELAGAIGRCGSIDRSACVARAARFDESVFDQKMRAIIERELETRGHGP